MIFFNGLNKKSDIVFICVDNTHLIKNDNHKQIIKNIADFNISNICVKEYDVINGHDANDILPRIADQYTHAVVFDADTEFTGSKFFKELKKLCAKDFFLAGHVLDRKEGYYELHSQCYVVNLKKYIQYKMPHITHPTPNFPHAHIEPIRSVENYHDDYTPLWIKSGTIKKQYQHLWHGNNILSVALENNETVLIFDEAIRNSKQCYYAQYENDFLKNSQHIHEKYKFSSTRLFYPVNTEELQQINIDGPITQLIIPASGFNWLHYINKYGYNHNTLISFYDYNPNSLYYIKNIVENFDGTDYYTFLKSIRPNETNDWIDSKEEINQHFETIKHLWHIVKKIKFNYHECDLLNDFNIPVINDRNTIMHLSNVFCYEPTAAFNSFVKRVAAENNLIKFLKDNNSEINLMVSVHAWSGLADYQKYTGSVNDFAEQNLNKCYRATWNQKEDWKIFDQKSIT